jgi:hypothetical protein
MKKTLMTGIAIVFALVAVTVSFAELKGGRIDLKAGDEVYVCACGEGCQCQTMARNPGKCTCDKQMAKAKVNKVEDGVVLVTLDGKERTFKTVGQYVCACGPACNCDTISQSPGKCVCGMDMKRADAKK